MREEKKEIYDLPDEELCLRAAQGDDEAGEQLLLRYKNFVRSKVRPYFLVGADKEDLMQEGMIGLYKAIRDFDAEKNVAFMSFADLCVTRQVITAIKTATRNKHIPLNTYVSLSLRIPGGENDRTLAEVIETDTSSNPEDIILESEAFSRMEKKLKEVLSVFERQVLELYLEGRPYSYIAEALHKDNKAVDNALQRVKSKLEKRL